MSDESFKRGVKDGREGHYINPTASALVDLVAGVISMGTVRADPDYDRGLEVGRDLREQDKKREKEKERD